jgi:hypothetical protein
MPKGEQGVNPRPAFGVAASEPIPMALLTAACCRPDSGSVAVSSTGCSFRPCSLTFMVNKTTDPRAAKQIVAARSRSRQDDLPQQRRHDQGSARLHQSMRHGG